jgi:hypothetical protein
MLWRCPLYDYQIFILNKADRFSRKRKLVKKCEPAKVNDNDLSPLHGPNSCNEEWGQL